MENSRELTHLSDYVLSNAKIFTCWFEFLLRYYTTSCFNNNNNYYSNKILIKCIKPGLYAFYGNNNNIKKNTLNYSIKTMSMNYLSTKIPIKK